MSREPLKLDHFAAPHRKRRWLGTLLLLASLVLAADLARRYGEVRQSIERLEAARASMPERRTAPAVPARLRQEQERSARAAVRQLMLPWVGLIEALESAATRDVALLQIEPEAERRTVTITAEARHAQAMLRYLRALIGAEGLSEVHLVSHEVRHDHPQQPIRFSARASFEALR